MMVREFAFGVENQEAVVERAITRPGLDPFVDPDHERRLPIGHQLQQAPVFMDLAGSVAKAIKLIEEAARNWRAACRFRRDVALSPTAIARLV